MSDSLTPVHRALNVGAGPLDYDLIEQAVHAHVKEAGDLDWKQEKYQDGGGSWTREAAKDIAAMANSGGGWIVMGVVDKDDRADSLSGVNWTASDEQGIRQVCSSHIYPAVTQLETHELPNHDGSLTVVALEVPAAGRPLHHVCPSPGTFRVPYRNGAHVAFHGAREAGLALLGLADPTLLLDDEPTEPVDRLKKHLLDPAGRMKVHDLVMGEANALAALILDLPVTQQGFDLAAYDEVLRAHHNSVKPLVALVITGISYDEGGLHDSLWRDVLQKLIHAGTRDVTGGYVQAIRRARLYPALLLFYAAVTACVMRGREQLIIDLATRTNGVRYDVDRRLVGCQILHPWFVLDHDMVKQLPRWAGTSWVYPESHLIRTDEQGFFPELDRDEFARTFAGLEYRISLLLQKTHESHPHYGPMPGEYTGEAGWSYSYPQELLAEQSFREDAEGSKRWPWIEYLGGVGEYEEFLQVQRVRLEDFQYHRMR